MHWFGFSFYSHLSPLKFQGIILVLVFWVVLFLDFWFVGFLLVFNKALKLAALPFPFKSEILLVLHGSKNLVLKENMK